MNYLARLMAITHTTVTAVDSTPARRKPVGGPWLLLAACLWLGSALALAVGHAVEHGHDAERASVVWAGGLDLVPRGAGAELSGELLEAALVVGSVGLGGGQAGDRKSPRLNSSH